MKKKKQRRKRKEKTRKKERKKEKLVVVIVNNKKNRRKREKCLNTMCHIRLTWLFYSLYFSLLLSKYSARKLIGLAGRSLAS